MGDRGKAANDRAGALHALVAAKPLVDALYAAFKSEIAGEKWQHWFRSSTNKDFYLLYNLYQKARLSLEVDRMNPVVVKDPARRPYRGNVVMHDAAKAGDPLFGSQAERINPTVFNGSRWSLTKFSLQDAFQVAGVETNAGKGEWLEIAATDHGRAYTLELRAAATVYVAVEKGRVPAWLREQGFQAANETAEAGFWGWPYRYRNRPPTLVKTLELYAKTFTPGEVTLGKNPADRSHLPYVVFVKPAFLLYENFRADPLGGAPAHWRTTGAAHVVDVPDYDGELRPSSFDLTTVARYTPLDLRGLRLESKAEGGLTCATRALSSPAEGDFVCDLRMKLGQRDDETKFTLANSEGRPLVTVTFDAEGRVTLRAGETETTFGTYGANRWYNFQIERSSAGRQKLKVALQDDQLQEQTTEISQPITGSVAHLELRHGGRRQGSWALLHAASLYRTSAP